MKNIIWDLSGTLFKPQIQNYNKEDIDNLSLLLYCWAGKKELNHNIEIIFKILDKFGTQVGPEDQIARISTGKPVPLIICKWLSGELTNKAAIKLILDQIKKESLNHEVKTKLSNLTKTFFNPYFLADCMWPIDSMVKILDKCNNSHKYNLYTLSNWDLESFDLFYKSEKAKPVFKNFKNQNITISAQTGYLKPQKEIYQYFIEKHKINPKESLFIDDQIENLEMAKEFGINTIHYKNNNSEDIELELKKNKII